MYLLVGVLFLAVGALMLIKPHVIFTIAENWKSNDSVEPSNLYIFSTRFGGAILLLVGALGVIAQFIL